MSTPFAEVSSSNLATKPQSLKPKRVTLRDVAERAGVQEACVSVVINGAKSNSHVSPAARERILVAAEELGYKRNSSMASMAKGRFGCVALLLSTNPDVSVLPSPVWEGIHDGLAQNDIHLSLFRLPDEKLSDRKLLPKIMREWMADGMLIDYTHNIPEDLTALINDNSLPAVWLNTKQPFDCVRPDDYAAGVSATEYLLKLGHTRIAYVHLYRFDDETKNHYSSHDREAGYLAAMQAAKLEPRLVIATDLARENQAAFITDFLRDEADRPTAVVTYGDESESIFWAASRMGLEVPRDLSIVGTSRSNCLWSGTRITSFLVPDREIGIRAATMIQQKIAAPQQKLPSLALPFEFELGNSVTGPTKRNS